MLQVFLLYDRNRVKNSVHFCKFLGIYFHLWVCVHFFTLIFLYSLNCSSIHREIEEVLGLLMKKDNRWRRISYRRVLWIALENNTLVLLAILTGVIGMAAANLIKVFYNLCCSILFVMLFLYCLINQIAFLRAVFSLQKVGNGNRKPWVMNSRN